MTSADVLMTLAAGGGLAALALLVKALLRCDVSFAKSVEGAANDIRVVNALAQFASRRDAAAPRTECCVYFVLKRVKAEAAVKPKPAPDVLSAKPP